MNRADSELRLPEIGKIPPVARVPHQAEAHGAPGALGQRRLLPLLDPERFEVADLVVEQRVPDEEAGRAEIEDREPHLGVAAGLASIAEVEGLESVARALEPHREAGTVAEELGVGVADLDVLRGAAEQPAEVPVLRLSEKVRLVVADEPGDSRGPGRAEAEVDVSGLLLLHPIDEVDVPVVSRVDLDRLVRRQRLEEAERLDVPDAVDQQLLGVDVARERQQDLPDHLVVREVVAHDLDGTDVRGLPFHDHPVQVHGRVRVDAVGRHALDLVVDLRPAGSPRPGRGR